MKSDVSTQAATTLSAIDEALRRADDLDWRDAGFRKWEREQVGEVAFSETSEETGLQSTEYWSPTVRPGLHCIRPMISIINPESEPATPMELRGDDYPPPEDTTYGPVLLGPEPAVVGGLCRACMGTGEAMDDGAECDGCDGSGRLTEQPSEQPGATR